MKKLGPTCMSRIGKYGGDGYEPPLEEEEEKKVSILQPVFTA
jgi:hypothetical protein